MGSAANDLYFSDDYNYSAMTSEKNDNVSSQSAAKPAINEKIKIISVGGGGSNALNHVISCGVENVELIAVNTDVRSLDMSQSPNKLVIGEKCTKGLGAGARPEVGEAAAKESINEIREMLMGSDMVYLTAGMGGGTGTGALPVIAHEAHEMGILTVAVVTKPFSFEGRRKMRFAEEGIKKLRENVDALIVIPNDRLLSICDETDEISSAFAKADDILHEAIVGVTDLVLNPGIVNVDFADLRAVMKTAGLAVMGVGYGAGDNRIDDAVKMAMQSPLMETPVNGAKGVLMNITCGKDFGLLELGGAASYVQDVIDEDATFVWGYSVDEALGDKVQVVIIAAGFDSVKGTGQSSEATSVAEAAAAPVVEEAAEQTREPVAEETPVRQSGAPSWLTSPVTKPAEPEAAVETAAATEPAPENEVKEAKAEDVFAPRTENSFDKPTFIRQKNKDKPDFVAAALANARQNRK